MLGLLPFSENAFSTDQLDTLFLVSGVSATGEVGVVLVSGAAIVPTTGVYGLGETGTVVVAASAVVPLTGVFSSGFVGSVTVTGTGFVFPTGVVGTVGLGTVVVVAQGNVVVTGVDAAAQLGFEFAYGWNDPNWAEVGLITVTFVDEVAAFSGYTPSATMYSGAIRNRIRNDPANWGAINDAQTSNWTEIAT